MAAHTRALSRRLLRTSIALIVLCGSAALSTSAGAATRSDAADRALDAALERFVKLENGSPGIVAVVQRDGEPILHTAGVAETTTGAAPVVDDHMRLASVAKAFSGAAALSVVAEGKLTLDSTIGESLRDLPSAWSEITLAQLLGHTSGIPDFSQTEAFGQAVTASLLVAPPPVELLSYVEDDPLEFTPGSKYHYSNSDNIIVGLMVAAATGSSYEQELATRVYAPLGLTRTSLPSGIELATPSIHGYAVDLPGAPEDVTEAFAAGWAWASGGIVSTPADATRFVRGYASGKTTNPATAAAQFRFRAGHSEPPGPGKNSAGLAVFRYKTPCGTVYGHTGNTAGYTQFIAATRDGSKSITVSINAQITPNSDAKTFARLRAIFGLGVCAALAAD